MWMSSWACILAAATAPLQEATVENLGVSSRYAWTAGRWAFFSVPEYDQNQTDLNGDGDFIDSVLHLYDFETRTLTDTGIAGGAVSLEEPFLTFVALEAEQGMQDLNGDGVLDFAVFAHDLRTHRNVLFQESWNDSPLLGDRVARAGHELLIALKDPQPILVRWSPAGQSLVPNGTIPWLLDEDNVITEVSEVGAAADLNGDGDQTDSIMHLYDLETGVETNLGLAGSPPYSLEARDLVLVIEAKQSVDLDGDGQLNSVVWHAVDPDGAVQNLGIGLRLPIVPAVTNALSVSRSLDPSFLPILAEETARDLNGDGDLGDFVLHHWVPATNTLENQGIAAASIFDTSPGAAGERWTFVEVLETDGDLNGDGDQADSFLGVSTGPGSLQVIPWALTGTPSSPLEDPRVVIRDRTAALVVGELEHGTDLNGDGDLDDERLFVFEADSGDVTALPWDVTFRDVQVIGNQVFALRHEVPGSDWNGDGDTNDRVLFGYDAAKGRTTNFGLAAADTFTRRLFAGETDLLVDVFEIDQGGTDLNGDGDAFDIVAHAIFLQR